MDYQIPLTVSKDIQIKGKKIGDYYYDESTDTIYYDLPYKFPCKFAVVALQVVIATPMMIKLPTFLKYHNIDWLRQQLLQVNLAQENKVLLHGSAWRKDGKTYLAVGFPNCGKTTKIIHETQIRGEWIADENVVVGTDLWLEPVPRQTSLSWNLAQYFDLTLGNKLDFAWKRLRAKLLPIYEPNIWIKIKTGPSSKLSHILYLTAGKNQSLALLTDNEFPFFTNPVIQTYAYATGWDLDGVYKKYREILNVISSNT